jgi:hypothetical protein
VAAVPPPEFRDKLNSKRIGRYLLYVSQQKDEDNTGILKSVITTK